MISSSYRAAVLHYVDRLGAFDALDYQIQRDIVTTDTSRGHQTAALELLRQARAAYLEHSHIELDIQLRDMDTEGKGDGQ